MRILLHNISKNYAPGFALPTVVIATVVMLMVLVAAVGSIASARVALDTQFYQQLARDATESGASQASDCLAANNYVATWSAGSPLRPNTNCTGGAACSDIPKCFIVKTSAYAVSYSVGAVSDNGSGVQTFTVTATVSLLRKSNGSIAKTVTSTGGIQIGAQVTTTSVVFGYTNVGSSGGGAFFATVGRDGIMRTTGLNEYGQLGNGSTANTVIPTKFMAPTTNPIVAGYANFLSVGWNVYAVDNAGKAYGAGINDHGQIGSGSTTTPMPTPQQVIIPGGRQVASVIPGGWTNYFLTTDGNLYASGMCDYGRLGNNYTITGCSDQALPVRVNLPTPNPADPNTIPTTNIVADRYTAFVRMAGGRVYGWGDDEFGELGDDAYTAHSSPVKIGTYGDAGQPQATQVAFDGNSVYILDSTGKLNSMGYTNYGQHGNRTVSIFAYNSQHCFDNAGADGVTMRLYPCNGTAAQRFEYRADGSIYNANVNKCLDNKQADGVTLQLYTCNGTAAQVYSWDSDSNRLTNPQTGKCVGNTSYDGTTLQLLPCGAYAYLGMTMTTTWLAPFNMSGISGLITAIATDEWNVSVLTTNGEVWSAGVNTSGMFGAGSSNLFQPDPVKFQLPAGVKAKYIYSSNSGAAVNYSYQNLMVVGDNGKVYGAGSNSYGQLGNGTTAAQQKTPVVMNVIDGIGIAARQVQVGYGTSVIYTTAGRVYTVGNNNRGQLGDGTTTNRSTPYLSQYINASSPTQY
jgi:alpha-tubulin suppressor-like RCC1 family protein